jgi:hypothetical protein
MAVQGYLDYCTHNAISVTTDSARAYMDEVTRRRLAKLPELWKDGLNWFFRAGRQHTSVTPHGVPPLHQADTGAVAWEQRQESVRRAGSRNVNPAIIQSRT